MLSNERYFICFLLSLKLNNFKCLNVKYVVLVLIIFWLFLSEKLYVFFSKWLVILGVFLEYFVKSINILLLVLIFSFFLLFCSILIIFLLLYWFNLVSSLNLFLKGWLSKFNLVVVFIKVKGLRFIFIILEFFFGLIIKLILKFFIVL